MSWWVVSFEFPQNNWSSQGRGMIGLEVQINCNSHRCWGWAAQISWLSNVEMWIRILKFWCSTGHFLAYTPENCHGEPKNHPFAKEKHLPNLHLLLIFRGALQMQEIPAKQNAMRLPFFFPGFLSLGRGVSEFSNGNGGLLFHLRRNQLVMLEPPSKNSTPPQKRKWSRLASSIISQFFQSQGWVKTSNQVVSEPGWLFRCASWMQTDAPLPKLSADCRAFENELAWNAAGGSHLRAVLQMQACFLATSCKARKVKRSDCSHSEMRRAGMTVADFCSARKWLWGEICELWIVAVLFLGHCHPLHLQVLVQLIVQGFLQLPLKRHSFCSWNHDPTSYPHGVKVGDAQLLLHRFT